VCEDCAAFGLTGLGRGGQQINRCRETFAKAVETLVELASLQVRLLSRFLCHFEYHDRCDLARLPESRLGLTVQATSVRRGESCTDWTLLYSLQTAFVILDEVIRMTNRRVNALEHVVIPRLENTISYINSECVVVPNPSTALDITPDPLPHLSPSFRNSCSRPPAARRLDEMDREEFFRLKKIQSKKKRDTAAREVEDAEKRDAAEAKAEQGREERRNREPAEPVNLLQDKDEDSELFFLHPSTSLTGSTASHRGRNILTVLLTSLFSYPLQSSSELALHMFVPVPTSSSRSLFRLVVHQLFLQALSETAVGAVISLWGTPEE
jgi:hypothetical protein